MSAHYGKESESFGKYSFIERVSGWRCEECFERSSGGHVGGVRLHWRNALRDDSIGEFAHRVGESSALTFELSDHLL